MAKANGFIVHLSKARQRVFREALDDQDYFAEAVNRFAHSRSAPLVCFVINTSGTITHIARGRRGMNAGTGQSRLNLTDIEAMTTKLTATDIIEGVPKRNRNPVEDRFLNGGLLTPRAFEEVVDLVSHLAPETKASLNRFSKSTRQRLSELTSKARGTLAYQKESVATALHMAGMDREPLAHWTLEAEDKPKSFLEGLPQARLREDPMIIHDMMNVPGYDYLTEIKVASAAVFEDGDNRLTVVFANRLPLEEQTGCDLIYYNETFNAFVMVHTKRWNLMTNRGLSSGFQRKNSLKKSLAWIPFLQSLPKSNRQMRSKIFALIMIHSFSNSAPAFNLIQIQQV